MTLNIPRIKVTVKVLLMATFKGAVSPRFSDTCTILVTKVVYNCCGYGRIKEVVSNLIMLDQHFQV